MILSTRLQEDLASLYFLDLQLSNILPVGCGLNKFRKTKPTRGNQGKTHGKKQVWNESLTAERCTGGYGFQARVPSTLKPSHCSGWFYHSPAITHHDNGREPWIKVTSMPNNEKSLEFLFSSGEQRNMQVDGGAGHYPVYKACIDFGYPAKLTLKT